MPAASPAILAITAGTAIYGAVQQNQQIQHAKGAAQAQETAINDQIKKQKDAEAASKTAANASAGANQSAALAAIRASMSAASNFGGTLLTSPSGTPSPNPGGKTLLGA